MGGLLVCHKEHGDILAQVEDVNDDCGFLTRTALEALEMPVSGVDKDDPWAVRLAEKQIIAALETARGEHAESEAFQRLVELLLEREMYQFRQFLVNRDSAED